MPNGTSGSLRSQAIVKRMTGGVMTEQSPPSSHPTRPGLALLAGWLGVLAAALLAVGAIPVYVSALALCVVLAVAWPESAHLRARGDGSAFDWEAFDDARDAWERANDT